MSKKLFKIKLDNILTIDNNHETKHTPKRLINY